MLNIEPKLNELYPDLHFGIMILENVSNPTTHPNLDSKKDELVETLRKEYGHLSKSELKALSGINHYQNFYKRFKKNYHVLYQLESITHKNRDFPNVAALVESMFMCEVKKSSAYSRLRLRPRSRKSQCKYWLWK